MSPWALVKFRGSKGVASVSSEASSAELMAYCNGLEGCCGGLIGAADWSFGEDVLCAENGWRSNANNRQPASGGGRMRD